MQCLTDSEIATWLADHDGTSVPCRKSKSPSHSLQFACPNRPLETAAFIRNFLNLLSSEILIQVTDWPLYKPSEMLVIEALRNLHGESRNLIDAPGHLIPAGEKEIAIALFGHTVNFQWNARLYVPEDFATLQLCNFATLQNWEGELMDFWSNDSTFYSQVVKLVNLHRLDQNKLG